MPVEPNPREAWWPSLQISLTALLPVLLPLGVLLLQAMLWDLIAPFGWIAFLPAVGICAWLCGLRGGLLALILSAGAVEWLLVDLPDGTSMAMEPRIFAALLFSVLGAAMLLVLDRARRERELLHMAALELQVAAFGFSAPAAPTPAARWWPALPGDLGVIRAVRDELDWHRQCLTALEIPLATFTREGRCLFANPAFLSAMRLQAEQLSSRNGLESGHFPATGLPGALRRLLDQPPPRQPETFRLPGAGEFRLTWLTVASGGVVVCSGDKRLPPPAPAAPLAASPPLAAAPDPCAGAATPPTLHRPPWRSISGLRCLVVDDQEINRELLREILRLEGAVPVCCNSGREALAAVTAAPESFDVVLMDLQMPGMDGYAAARAIRAVVDSERLPILAITADGPGVPAARLRDAGIQGLLHKPLEIEKMRSLLAIPGPARPDRPA